MRFTTAPAEGTEFTLAGYGALRVTWTGPLGPDDEVDLVATVDGSCSGWGECEYAVFWGCGRGTYRLVHGPEYALSLSVGPRDPRGYAQLIRLERWGDMATPEVRVLTLTAGDRGYAETSAP